MNMPRKGPSVNSRTWNLRMRLRPSPHARQGLTCGACPAPTGPGSHMGFAYRRLHPTAIHGAALRAVASAVYTDSRGESSTSRHPAWLFSPHRQAL